MGDWFDDRLALLARWQGYRYSVENKKRRMRADLDANENWNVPESEVRGAVKRALARTDPRSYPKGSVEELQKGISRAVGVSPGSVIPCSGADQAIDLLCQGFLGPRDQVTIISPTFSMYRLRATIAGATCVEIPVGEGFSLPLEGIKRVGGAGGLLFICSPNNPTGTQFAEPDVTEAISSFKGLTILDEAYVEFADYSLSRRVKEFRNLAVLRTFSKAYGMAGLRLGYVLANDSWAPDFLSRVQYPYPISSTAAATALELMARPSHVRKWVATVKKEREWLSKELRALGGVGVAESQANFILISVPIDSAKAHSELERRGIATRDVGNVPGMQNTLRVTVGTRRMNELLLTALKRVLQNAV